ncbi:MAG TPA: ribosome biogenesis GTPase Der [Chthoniobacterales bacterium]
MSQPYPLVAIVGRPNVGKSALFNRLAGKRIAIVHDQPGVTRDRLTALCKKGSVPFEVIDTGGIISAINDNFDDAVRAEAELAMESAAIILFVVDGTAGFTPADQELARILRRSQKPVLLVVNKVDHEKHDGREDTFSGLGFVTFPVSAEHNRGLDPLIQRIEALLPASETDSSPPGPRPIKLALVGRPNVGKSSLINAILDDRRTIVSDVAGTTRDAIDIPYRLGNRDYVLIDTAGIRHRSKHDTSVEVFSVIRSEKTIERADLCVLVLDASAGLTAQDKKIAGLIQKAEKPCIVIVNKSDLLDEAGKQARRDYLQMLGEELFFLDYAPRALVSAKTGKRLGDFFACVERVIGQSEQKLTTGPLNRLLKNALITHPPPAVGNRRLKIYYATRIDPEFEPAIPVPRFLLFVNKPDALTQTYAKYLENQLRAEIPYEGLPVLLKLREREHTTPGPV